jgi:hypothetical protein
MGHWGSGTHFPYQLRTSAQWGGRGVTATTPLPRLGELSAQCPGTGREGPDVWYTGQTWGETLCEACYETPVQAGQARGHEDPRALQ